MHSLSTSSFYMCKAVCGACSCLQEMVGSSGRPPLGSCRAGSVVSMLTASGAAVPVRLAITSRDEQSGDKMTHRHIIKVRLFEI